MRIPFKTAEVDGDECVMVLRHINPKEIRLNLKTKEIFIITDEVPPLTKPKNKGPKK